MEPFHLGVMGCSAKENERRLPIHPHHLERIDRDLLARIHLEEGYGERFGVTDDELVTHGADVRPRGDLIAACDVILAAKPLEGELAELRSGQVLWGWVHAVQDEHLTQVAIDRRLTLITFEAMHHWDVHDAFNLHVFHKNNELAGYCSVLHALQLSGSTGDYGRTLRAAVIGFGATARGAVTLLNAHGVYDVDVLTGRGVTQVASPIPSARIVHLEYDVTDPAASHVLVDGDIVPLASFLAEHDIVVNCVLQNPSAPMIFLMKEDLARFTAGSLIIDVSCDRGMGFEWARPTTFERPMLFLDHGVRYYAVDHTPSYLWDSATWEISEALLPFLRPVLDGPGGWEASDTIRHAIEMRDGVVQNPEILSFQGRNPDFPHERL